MAHIGAVASESLHYCRQVHDEHDATIAENRSAADQVRRYCLVVQCFDDQFLFAFEGIHNQPQLALPKSCDQDEELASASFCTTTLGLPQPRQRQHLIAELQYFGGIHFVDLGFICTCDFSYRIQRDRIQPLFNSEQQRLDDGQCQWQFEAEFCSVALLGFKFNSTLEPMQHASHHVEPDPAP